jgi:hypothetical protein
MKEDEEDMQYALETREMHGRDEMWYAWEDNIKLELSSVSGCEVYSRICSLAGTYELEEDESLH